MRNPNGYGSIKKLSGNRRRPYVFVVTQKDKSKALAYFETHAEALIYQADYAERHKKRPLSDHEMTFLELYHRWLPVHTDRTAPSQSALTGYRVALDHCQTLWDMPLSDVRYKHVQAVVDAMKKSGLSYASCKKVRSLITLMFRYGEQMEYCTKTFAGLIHLGKNKPVRPHVCFSRQKINRLWRIADMPGVDSVLILLYTGMRIGELLALKKTDINRRQKYIKITKSKTKSGIRIIPIHPRIWPLIETRLSSPDDFLITDENGRPYSYARYCQLWKSIMKEIHGEKHTPHDTRHTFATLLDNAEVNEAAKKRILGHAGKDVTEAVYTHKSLRQLRKAIERLT